jgi:hypothetical protein
MYLYIDGSIVVSNQENVLLFGSVYYQPKDVKTRCLSSLYPKAAKSRRPVIRLFPGFVEVD